ncbi:MAG TPA: sugar phosphate nucleotidyltransferase [Flavobacteriaceae bacterium]|nr:sugar phosphate nucleotidyltransferase [Flavobacteriaceae bacterium]
MTTIHKASLLILAGGMGSRYKNQKQVDTVSSNKETLMEFALYDAIKVGIKKFVFIINDKFPSDYRKRITDILTDRNCEVHFVEQTLDKFIPELYQYKLKERVKPLGTAHAVLCAKEVIQEPFITMNADDFYGYKTFEKAYHHLTAGKISEYEFAMCAFELENTLSKNGSVSRGICKVSSANKLSKVEEFTYIERVNGVIKGLNEKLKAKTLKEEDKVSMNFWILHPSFFEMAMRDLVTFLEENENLSRIEFYLPSVVDKGIQEGKVRVEVLSTSEKWFGLTYPGDKDRVMKELEAKKEKKLYPTSLWENIKRDL